MFSKEKTSSIKNIQVSINELENERAALKRKVRSLQVELLELMSGYKIGDKIEYEGKKGIIVDADNTYYNYHWRYNPIKKDGTVGERYFTIYDTKKCKKISE